MQFKHLLAIGAFGLGVHAFWRLECHGVTGMARIDPLMSPGGASQHLHVFHGSNGMSEYATNDDLMAGTCTSCSVTQDRSAYWIPVMYFRDAATGNFELVPQVGGTLVYYLLNTNPGETKVRAFPKGFRMIAGDNSRREYTLGDLKMPDPEKSRWAALGQTTQADLKQRAIGFNCLNYHGQPEGTLMRHYLPDKSFLDGSCPDGIRLEVMFPSCWNGKDIDSENHGDHVAYPDLVMDGTCPDSHPIRLISLMYETIWATNSFNGRAGEFVMSNGDTTGLAYHADFMMGWDEGFLQQAADQCTNLSGLQGDCHLFTLQNDGVGTSCKMPTPKAVAGEKFDGPGLSSLPGNVKVNGPPGAPPAAGTFTAQVLHAPDVATQAPPPPPAITDAPGQAYAAVSTQRVTAANIVTEVVWEEAVVYVTEEVDVTSTIIVAPTAPVKVKARGHLRRHQGRHGHGL